jgi:hypothetical protein
MSNDCSVVRKSMLLGERTTYTRLLWTAAILTGGLPPSCAKQDEWVQRKGNCFRQSEASDLWSWGNQCCLIHGLACNMATNEASLGKAFLIDAGLFSTRNIV